MPLMTPEQIRGTKLEIWAEQLYKDLGYLGVHRNVQYHRSRYKFRQVDVVYHDLNLFNTLVIVELKYTCHENIRLDLRAEKHKADQRLSRIETILQELEERRQFVEARKAVLMTNGTFAPVIYS